MPVTSYTDPGVAWAAWALQARTNSSGTPLDDAGGEDARLAHEGFTAGVFGTNDFQVLQNSPTGMSVLVGSGSAKDDVAQIQGTDAGQGFYRVRLGTATTTVTITAADASNPRVDEIYLVVQDTTYDSSGNVVPRIGYRRGDAAGSPVAPGPDASWDAYLLIATIAVAASATSIVNANITDERVSTHLSLPHADGAVELAGSTRLATITGVHTVVDAPLGEQVKMRVGGIDELIVGTAAVNLAHNDLIGVASIDAILMGGTTGSPSLSTSDAQLLGGSVSIPGTWNSWSIVATASGVYSISGSVSSVRLYLRPGATGAGPFNDFDFTPDGNSMPFGITLYRSGLTATGTVTIALRGSKTGAGSVTLPAGSLSFTVRRDS